MKLMLFIFVMNFMPVPDRPETPDWENKADTVLKYAMDELGTSYKWGTCKPGESFDCSGFTYYAYNKIGVLCPRTSEGLANTGETVDFNNCRKGDLMLFRGTDPIDKSVGHVGIVCEKTSNALKFIHCSSSKRHYGVVITDYHSSGYPKRFIGVKRLIHD